MRGFLVQSLLLVAPSFVHATTRRYSLTIANADVNPDGFKRSAVIINGITPGPIITATKGDDILVNVTDSLNDPGMRQSTSVHWHGILQPRTAYDDGPAFVTQCPIVPGNSYQYRLELSDQAGTFWYHSHLSSQYIDGLRGALVIYDPKDPHISLYDVDTAGTIISLTDWYHTSAEKLGEDWIAGKIPEPVPDSTLLNGIGRYKGGPTKARSVITVQRGKRYRLRIINMSAVLPFNFGIEGHPLTVIEVDGVNHEAIKVNTVAISAGQRYSVVIAANQPVRNYWIAYPSNFRETTTPTANPNYNGTEAFAILRYQGAPVAPPRTPEFVPDTVNVLKEQNLVPLESPKLPAKADMVIPLNFTVQNPGAIDTPGGATVWLVNGKQYQPPKLPTLLRILSGNATSQSDFGANEDTYVLPSNKTIDVQLIGSADHPFHLHGHTFQVIQSASGPRNVINPPIRDTVDTNGSQDPATAVTIRFRTDNPGPWFLHCHKDWHLEAGLAVVFAEDIADQRQGPLSLNPSKQWSDLCSIYANTPANQQ